MNQIFLNLKYIAAIIFFPLTLSLKILSLIYRIVWKLFKLIFKSISWLSFISLLGYAKPLNMSEVHGFLITILESIENFYIFCRDTLLNSIFYQKVSKYCTLDFDNIAEYCQNLINSLMCSDFGIIIYIFTANTSPKLTYLINFLLQSVILPKLIIIPELIIVLPTIIYIFFNLTKPLWFNTIEIFKLWVYIIGALTFIVEFVLSPQWWEAFLNFINHKTTLTAPDLLRGLFDTINENLIYFTKELGSNFVQMRPKQSYYSFVYSFCMIREVADLLYEGLQINEKFVNLNTLFWKFSLITVLSIGLNIFVIFTFLDKKLNKSQNFLMFNDAFREFDQDTIKLIKQLFIKKKNKF